MFMVLLLASCVFGAQQETPNTELLNYKIEQLQKTIDELKKDVDEAKKSEQGIESLKYRLEDANSRVDIISGGVDRFGVLATILGGLVTVLLVGFSFVSYLSVKSKAKEEAREAAKKETEEWINKEAQTTLQSIIDKLEKEAQEKIAKAVETAKEGIKSQSKAEELFMQGLSHSSAKEYDKAIEAYQKSLAIYPHNDATYYNIGNTYTKQKKYENALVAYQKAIEINPNNDSAYYNMGYVYDEQKNYKDALVAYQKAIEINPKKDEAYFNIGILYANQEKYAEAIVAYQKAIEINPQKNAAYTNLFELQLILNQPFKDENKFLEFCYENKEAMMIYEMLKILQGIAFNSAYALSKKAWMSKYQGVTYNWGWNEINIWLHNMPESETKTHLLEAVDFFKKALKA